MHYTGTIWRPPYEAESLLLEVQILQHNPASMATARLQGLSSPKLVKRVFLTGANPFVLKTEKLIEIVTLIQKYLPSVESIGCFSRITDSMNKSDEELKMLRQAGYNGLTIGVETGDDTALAFMHKGYTSQDILAQCKRLEKAGIEYGFFYLTGISGKGNGEEGAKASAEVFNQLHPFLIGPNMLTIYPNSELYQEIQKGRWEEEGELEKYRELRSLVSNLTVSTCFAAMGASNPFQLRGQLPADKENLLVTLDKIISEVSEDDLQQYRKNLPHL